MTFTVHSHCLDIAKHCALLHTIVERLLFYDRGEEKKKRMEKVTVCCDVVFSYRADCPNRNPAFLSHTHLMTNYDKWPF